MLEVGAGVRVRFAGPPGRTGPLTVGQANMLLCNERNEPAHINMHVVWDLPAGTGLEQVATALADLHVRHESLRTRYPAPLPGNSEPMQVVHAEGEFVLDVHAASGDAAMCAEDLGLTLRGRKFDAAADWPVRAAVVTVDDAPTHLVLALSHAAVDASALGILRREWLTLVTGGELPEPAAVRPVDQALRERSENGRRRSASSLAYWAGQLRTNPQAMLAVPRGTAPDHEPGWTPRLRIRSDEAARALDVLTEQTGVSKSTLVLTALCALVARHADQRQAVVTTLSANRYLPDLAEYLGTVAQDALLSVPVDISEDGEETFATLARRVRKRTQLAYPNSWFDSIELWERIDTIGLERGTHHARDCVFNDLSPLGLDGGVLRAGSDPRDPEQAVQLTRLPDEPLDVGVMLWVFRLEGALDLSLWADPRRLAPAAAEALGCGIATVLIAAARGEVRIADLPGITGLHPVARGPRWLVADGCWVDLDEVEELIASALPAAASMFGLTAEPDPVLGHRLVCEIAVTEPGSAGPDLVERLHEACVAGLVSRPAAMAPHEYRVVVGGHGDHDESDRSRAALPVLFGSTGRRTAEVAVC
jgi:hypothetical protein